MIDCIRLVKNLKIKRLWGLSSNDARKNVKDFYASQANE